VFVARGHSPVGVSWGMIVLGDVVGMVEVWWCGGGSGTGR